MRPEDDYEDYKGILSHEEYLEYKNQTTADTPALLCTVSDNIEALAVESLLRSGNIPVMKKWRTGGDLAIIYMGASSTGADLYVPSKLLENAKELLAAEPVTDETDTPDILNDYSEFAEQKAKDRRSKALILFLVFISPLLFVALYFLWEAIRNYT